MNNNFYSTDYTIEEIRNGTIRALNEHHQRHQHPYRHQFF